MDVFLLLLPCIVSYLVIRSAEVKKFGYSLSMKEALDADNPHKFHVFSRLKYASLPVVGMYIGDYLNGFSNFIVEGISLLLVIVSLFVFFMFATSLLIEAFLGLFFRFFGD